MKENPSEPRKYIEVALAQAAKKIGGICGDYVVVDRTPEATTVIVADGIGTGIKARVAAVMCASRLMELIRLGFSLREAVGQVVDTMHEARTADIPFSAFTVCRLLNSGHTTALSYEIPVPILISKRYVAYLPEARHVPMGLEMVAEVNCTLNQGDGIVIVSDGVSQAGLGHQYRMGWGTRGASDYINGLLVQGVDFTAIPPKIVEKVREISGSSYGDDTTCVALFCREERTLNILTGPPAKKAQDVKFVEAFLEQKGTRVVCGSTTTEIVGRVLKVPVKVSEMPDTYHTPPKYQLAGIDMATEGAVTLNQVYNILDEPADKLEMHSAVSDLYRLLHGSDTINFFVGTATNQAHKNIVFRQMGVLPREVIVELLAQKLRKMGKLVNTMYT